jgi:hypothetical protein
MSIEMEIAWPTLKELQDAFKLLPNNIAAKHMAAALGRAIDPTFKLIRQLTPRGPTGNLKKAVRKKTTRTKAAERLSQRHQQRRSSRPWKNASWWKVWCAAYPNGVCQNKNHNVGRHAKGNGGSHRQRHARNG